MKRQLLPGAAALLFGSLLVAACSQDNGGGSTTGLNAGAVVSPGVGAVANDSCSGWWQDVTVVVAETPDGASVQFTTTNTEMVPLIQARVERVAARHSDCTKPATPPSGRCQGPGNGSGCGNGPGNGTGAGCGNGAGNGAGGGNGECRMPDGWLGTATRLDNGARLDLRPCDPEKLAELRAFAAWWARAPHRACGSASGGGACAGPADCPRRG